MKAAYTYHPSSPDRKTDHMVIASREDWAEFAHIVWNWAPDLNAPTVRAFFEALESQGIRP